MSDEANLVSPIRTAWAGRRDALGRRHRRAWITLWHINPRAGAAEGRGWLMPPSTDDESEALGKLARWAYPAFFPAQQPDSDVNLSSVDFEPGCFDAIHWAWRAIRLADRRNRSLSQAELETVAVLASTPRVCIAFDEVRDLASFTRFFIVIRDAYRRDHRPWWRHRRWDVLPWRIQLHWRADAGDD